MKSEDPIATAIESLVDAGALAGAAALIWRGDKIAQIATVGWRDVEARLPILETFIDATHVLGYYNDLLVCHALWITRYLKAGTNPIMRTAYVEAVATEAKYRSRGFASAVLKHLVGEVQEYDLAALSPFNVEYYQRLGWELWQGPLFIRTKEDLIPSLDEGEVMIFRLPKTPLLDLTASLSAEWRKGELW